MEWMSCARDIRRASECVGLGSAYISRKTSLECWFWEAQPNWPAAWLDVRRQEDYQVPDPWKSPSPGREGR